VIIGFSNNILHHGVTIPGVKVKSSQCLIKHHAMKTYGGVEVNRQVFPTSALDEVSGQFTPRPLVKINILKITISLGVLYEC